MVSVPTSAVTTYSRPMDSMPVTDDSGTRPISTALPRAQTMSTGRRRLRSSKTPAGKERRITGTKRSALITPTWNTVALSVRIATSGIVNWVTWVPISDTDSPAHSLTKSRLASTPSRDRAGTAASGAAAPGPAASGPAASGAAAFTTWSEAIDEFFSGEVMVRAARVHVLFHGVRTVLVCWL